MGVIGHEQGATVAALIAARSALGEGPALQFAVMCGAAMPTHKPCAAPNNLSSPSHLTTLALLAHDVSLSKLTLTPTRYAELFHRLRDSDAASIPTLHCIGGSDASAEELDR